MTEPAGTFLLAKHLIRFLSEVLFQKLLCWETIRCLSCYPEERAELDGLPMPARSGMPMFIELSHIFEGDGFDGFQFTFPF